MRSPGSQAISWLSSASLTILTQTFSALKARLGVLPDGFGLVNIGRASGWDGIQPAVIFPAGRLIRLSSRPAHSVILVEMRQSLEERHSELDVAGPRRALVLGYQGTLRRDLDCSSLAKTGADAACCIGKLLFERWVNDASRELERRLRIEQGAGAGEPVDSALTEVLRERFAGILAQVMIACPEISEEEIAQRFPAVPVLLKRAAAEWVNGIAILHQRLRGDASRLARWLGYTKLPALESLIPASSDQHGTNLAIRLLFRDGRCIYYKPRPVAGEWLWDELVKAVNAHSSLKLASASALFGTTGRYGWVTSIARERVGPFEAGYWEAAGATLCLAEHLRMTDLHMANVMATNGGPVLFDLESIGTPQAASDRLRRGGTESYVANAIKDLLDTGLLPRPNAAGLPDTSGLFGKAASVPQVAIPQWSSGTDGVHRLQLRAAALVDQGNAPDDASPVKALPQMVSGYRDAAMALIRCRERLVGFGSAWRWTLEHPHAPRIILRDTLTYGILLSRSLEATQLQAMHSRDFLLRSALAANGNRAFPKAIRRTEAQALLRLHIPRFIALPGSRTLAGNSGRPLAPRFFACSPDEAVLSKISRLSSNQLSEVQIPALLLTVFEQLK